MKSTLLRAAFGLFITAVFGTAQAVIINIDEAGFETPAQGSGFSAFTYAPAGSAWSFGGGAGLTGNASGFTSANPNAPEGAQVAFLQGQGATISQTLTGLTAGTYTLSFQAAQRAMLDTVNPQVVDQTFDVFLGGILMGSFDPTSTTYSLYTTGTISLAAGNHTLSFVSTSLNGIADTSAFIDDLSLNHSPVPIPGPMALLALGLTVLIRRQHSFSYRNRI